MVAKPQSPILAGFIPVAKHCQAGTLSGGTIDFKIPCAPPSKNDRIFGSLSIHFWIRYGEAESIPTTRASIFTLPRRLESEPLKVQLGKYFLPDQASLRRRMACFANESHAESMSVEHSVASGGIIES